MAEKKIITETVFFLNKLSVEEEMEIINAEVKEVLLSQLETREYITRTQGNIFYKRDDELYDEIGLLPKPIFSEKSGALCAMMTCFVYIPPFYNFLTNFCEKNKEFLEETEAINNLYKLLNYFKERSAKFPPFKFNKLESRLRGDFKNVVEMYNELSTLIHEDLIKRYTYTEDDMWKDSQEQLHKPIQLYNEYSPMVDLFQSKIKKSSDSKKNKNSSFEFINAFSVDQSKIEFNKFIERLSSFNGVISILKYPHVLVFIINNYRSPLPQEIEFRKTKYRLISMLCKQREEEEYFALVNAGAWFLIDNKVKEVVTYDLDCQVELCFYLAKNYDFD